MTGQDNNDDAAMNTDDGGQEGRTAPQTGPQRPPFARPPRRDGGGVRRTATSHRPPMPPRTPRPTGIGTSSAGGDRDEQTGLSIAMPSLPIPPIVSAITRAGANAWATHVQPWRTPQQLYTSMMRLQTYWEENRGPLPDLAQRIFDDALEDGKVSAKEYGEFKAALLADLKRDIQKVEDKIEDIDGSDRRKSVRVGIAVGGVSLTAALYLYDLIKQDDNLPFIDDSKQASEGGASNGASDGGTSSGTGSDQVWGQLSWGQGFEQPFTGTDGITRTYNERADIDDPTVYGVNLPSGVGYVGSMPVTDQATGTVLGYNHYLSGMDANGVSYENRYIFSVNQLSINQEQSAIPGSESSAVASTEGAYTFTQVNPLTGETEVFVAHQGTEADAPPLVAALPLGMMVLAGGMNATPRTSRSGGRMSDAFMAAEDFGHTVKGGLHQIDELLLRAANKVGLFKD